jgi:glutamate--cysteine ligase
MNHALADRSSSSDAPLRSPDELLEYFHASEKPRSAWRIGAEAEKFGIDALTGAPLQYEGGNGVLRVLSALIEAHGWQPERETPDGPIIALRREQAAITLEPGAQLELSGAPLPDIHGICAEARGHMAELRHISSEMNLVWLGVGFHPLARQPDLPWVPKQRYRVMREFLPTRGSGALDMMRRTATVQANFDYSDGEDALRKLRVSLVMAPLINAMTANSPFFEGRISGKKSLRGEVWLRMDPDRSGLLPQLWRKEKLGYRDWVEWALDAPMFLFKRDGRVIENTGQTFRDFMTNGSQGERPTRADWKLHLNTLFPEARLKNTLEVRACDSLPTPLACSVAALYTGLLYDQRALELAEVFAARLSYEEISAARPALIEQGLGASIAGRPARELALEVLEIGRAGLVRRARISGGGNDESIHLLRLAELNESGRSPSDLLTEGLSNDDPDLTREIIARTRI